VVRQEIGDQTKTRFRSEQDALDREGYVLIERALDAATVERLRRAFEGAPVQDGGTQHVDITERTPELEAWQALEHHPALAAAASHVLGTTHCLFGIHGRNPQPGYGQQGLHSDWTREPDNHAVLVTALWMLDDFTTDNGATRVGPGSHLITRPIAKDFAQPLARHPHEKIVTGRAGDVLIFNAYLWHSGRRNQSKGPRRAVQMSVRSSLASPSIGAGFRPGG
jgi:ectoine hydroxylase-related dioxygenase (phytanoyl-CoA dioxygenase family)